MKLPRVPTFRLLRPQMPCLTARAQLINTVAGVNHHIPRHRGRLAPSIPLVVKSRSANVPTGCLTKRVVAAFWMINAAAFCKRLPVGGSTTLRRPLMGLWKLTRDHIRGADASQITECQSGWTPSGQVNRAVASTISDHGCHLTDGPAIWGEVGVACAYTDTAMMRGWHGRVV
jgi:hypothetical protein